MTALVDLHTAVGNASWRLRRQGVILWPHDVRFRKLGMRDELDMCVGFPFGR